MSTQTEREGRGDLTDQEPAPCSWDSHLALKGTWLFTITLPLIAMNLPKPTLP